MAARYRGSQDLRSTQRREDFQAFGGIRSLDDLNSQSPWQTIASRSFCPA
jgi:hypothetical protein